MSESTRKFKTEVQQLLNLMIHSLYSNKDIFLRELIANATDAIDKARFESLTKPDIACEWAIRLEMDKDKRILKITDNGIGMTREEVVANIGTIAKSGTKAFVEAMEKKKQQDQADLPELIGQFGVGFYSAFMVAEKVELLTRSAVSDTPAVRWESTGHDSYTIDDAEKAEQGTTISIYLKEDAKAYLEEWKIREIVKKYSDFIEYPIILPVTEKQEDGTEKTEDKILNSQKAIWLRNPSEITEEEHKNFFDHLAHFGGEILRTIHYSAEGTSEFKALLYLPEKAPFDLFTPDQRRKGLHLYVRRVFISDDCKNLLPEYLRFVRGVVDSSDLPLNISRELLQENNQILKIQKNLVRKIISELQKLQENEPGKYIAFFKEFGKVLKEGIHLDFTNKDKLLDLAIYETMNSDPEKYISFKEYVTAMPPSQKEIYYITGENRAVLENSPHLEFMRSKGFDVLFMTDPIDEWVVQSVPEYSGKKLKAVGKGEIELDEDTRKEAEKKTKQALKEHKNLLEFLKASLEDEIKEVRFSQRLTESACCLVGDDFAPSSNMERIFKAMNQEMPKTKRILELNPDHPLVDSLQKLYDQDSKSTKLGEYASLLYDQAMLTDGCAIPDPLNFSRKIADLMVAGVNQELKN
jgi:molecular chaperone HtpG